MKRLMTLGLDNDLLKIVALFFAAVAFMWLFVGCELFDSAERTTQQTGDAAETIGEAVKDVAEALSWGIYVLVGYIAGELRRPAAKVAKRMVNGIRNGPSDGRRAKRVRRK